MRVPPTTWQVAGSLIACGRRLRSPYANRRSNAGESRTAVAPLRAFLVGKEEELVFRTIAAARA